MKILIINGPNINMLGLREPEVYGSRSYPDLLGFIDMECKKLNVEVECFQSNHEGAIIDKIHETRGQFDGIVINPAAYTHTSIAIFDALKAVELPTVEVHLSNIDEREPFRRHSYISDACVKTITGKGFDGYAEAMSFLREIKEN